MTDDVRAAAERWRQRIADPRWAVLNRPKTKADTAVLLDAYLADHPADNGDPLTPEWLLAAGLAADDLTWHGHGPATGYVLANRIGFRCCDGRWAAYLLSPDGFDGSEDWLVETPTRGHLRRLCAALDIPLPEGR